MKYAAAFCLVFFSCSSFANCCKTLVEDELRGKWKPFREYSETQLEIEDLKPTEIILNFDSPNKAVLSKFYKGEAEVLNTHEFKRVGNLFYWKFVRDEGFYYELVLGGWELQRDKNSKALFGHLYLVSSENGLFNGWPVHLYLESTNNHRQ